MEKGTENQTEIEIVVLDSDGSESHVDSEVGIASFCFCSSSVFRPVPPFLQKIYEMLGNDEINSIVSWSCTGTSFVIKNSHLFAANVLPIYFRHNNFHSFIAQLNSYGKVHKYRLNFVKISGVYADKGFKKISWGQWEYRNEYFRKGERDLLKNIKRRDSYNSSRIQASDNSDIKPCVDTSSCSRDMEKELAILMEEHHQVKAEIMKLKEKQQTLEEKFASLRNREISNKDDQKRMMLVAERILNKQRESSNARVKEIRDKDLKGKRKLEMESAITQDNKGKMLLDEEEIAKHQPNTLISLEDLIGESLDWIEYVKELQEKASNLKS